MTTLSNRAVALGLAAAMTAAAFPAFAAPVLSSTATVKESGATQTTEIQWRGRRGGAVAAGAAAGFIGGLALGAAVSQPRYYNDPGYAYGPAYYEPAPSYYYAPAPAPAYTYVEPGYAYAPAPVYSAPAYRYRSGSNLCPGGGGANGQGGASGIDPMTCLP